MINNLVRFPNPAGALLAGKLELPDAGEPVAFALFAHCFTCSKDIKSINWISRGLAERGVAVLRFDFTGLGESEGRFSETTFSSNIEDVLAAADFLSTRHAPPAILIGHSLGGTAMLAAAPRVPACRLVATLAAPADTRHIREMLMKSYPDILRHGESDVSFGGRTVRIRRAFLDDLASHDIERDLAGLGRALMVFHSPADKTLGFDHALRIFQAAREPRSLVTLEDADHLLVRQEEDSRYVVEVIAAWARRYAGRPAAPEAG
jgi:putative redox protein